jgi:GGDEF domain-containing protein
VEEEEVAGFRESIQRESDATVDEIAPQDLLVRAGSVLKELEDYNRRVANRYRLESTEYREMVKMLASAIGTVSAASQGSISAMTDIGRRIATASQLEDLRQVKASLSDCLTEIKQEADRQRAESEATVIQLRENLYSAQKRAAAVRAALPARDPSVDTVTGLPLRPAAEAALADPGSEKSESFACVMVLDHLQLLNNRFGREAGDEIMLAFAEKMKQRLGDGDRLFRWSGPVLVGVLINRINLELTRAEMGRQMETKMEHSLETSTRSVLLPISVRWCVFPNINPTRLLSQRIDNFAARPVTQD